MSTVIKNWRRMCCQGARRDKIINKEIRNKIGVDKRGTELHGGRMRAKTDASKRRMDHGDTKWWSMEAGEEQGRPLSA